MGVRKCQGLAKGSISDVFTAKESGMSYWEPRRHPSGTQTLPADVQEVRGKFSVKIVCSADTVRSVRGNWSSFVSLRNSLKPVDRNKKNRLLVRMSSVRQDSHVVWFRLVPPWIGSTEGGSEASKAQKECDRAYPKGKFPFGTSARRRFGSRRGPR